MIVGLRAETVAEIETMEQEFTASEKEFKQEIKKTVQEVRVMRVMADLNDRAFTQGIDKRVSELDLLLNDILS